MLNYVICFVMSGITTYFLTKLAIIMSKRFGFNDLPIKRKLHTNATPMLGGLALFGSIMLNTSMFLNMAPKLFFVGMCGAFSIFLLGLIDDRFSLHPLIKVCVQIIIISLLFFNDLRIDYLTFPTTTTPIFFSATISFIVTQCWMILIINMFNIIDGIDGLAVGVSFITSIILFFVSLTVSPIFIPFLLISIAGSTLSFLRFNFYPAKIFLGDSGSLLLGYLFAYISILGVLKSTISFLILIFVFAIPMMDLVLSVIRRIMKKKNIFYPDLGHIHHQLVRRGLSVPKATVILYFCTGIFGCIAIISSLNSGLIQILMGGAIFFAVLMYFLFLQMSKKRFKNLKQKKDKT